MSARRMAMGGVALGSVADNVAYRAVPRGPGHSSGFSIPIGLIAVASDPPTFDQNDPDFNVFEIANLIQSPPWNLQLGETQTPSSDVVVSLGRDHLQVDLGDVRDYLPKDDSRAAALGSLPLLGFGVGPFFTSVGTVVHYENSIGMNEALKRALVDGQAFQTRTEYEIHDDLLAQAAAQWQLGWAGALSGRSKDPRQFRGFGLYGGVRGNLMRGLGYMEASNAGAFTTQDELFANSPVTFDYVGAFRQAEPNGGGMGTGFDLGLVGFVHGLEIGVGLNNVASTISWKGSERASVRDSVSGEYNIETIREDVKFTSKVPLRSVVNVARAFGPTVVAADVTNGLGDTQVHVGMEHWMRWLALRAGARLDEQSELQYSGGLGLRAGWFGVDVAVATHSRTLNHERGAELGMGFSFYH